MIISRYLCREIFNTLLITTIFLLFLILCNLLIRYLGNAAGGEMPANTVLKLASLQLPNYLADLLPISLFFSVIFSYGRLFSDSEMSVLFSCGLSWSRLAWISLIPAVCTAIFLSVLTLWLVPHMAKHFDQLNRQIQQTKNLSIVPSGIFTALGSQQIAYINHSDKKHNQMSGLFLYRNPAGSAPEVILAPTAYQMTDPKTGYHYVVLNDGYSYKAEPAAKNYQIIHFRRYAIRTNTVTNRSNSMDMTVTTKLLAQKTLAATAELQWRLALPIAAIVAALLALVLSSAKPRQGRYGKLLPAILVFALYFNSLTIGHSWLKSGKIPPIMGLWLIHAIFLLVALWQLWQLNRERGAIFPFRSSYLLKKRRGAQC